MDRIDRQQLLEALFTQSLDGIFFMLLEQPVRWDETVDKGEVLEYVISHQQITAANDAFCAQYLARQDQIIGKRPLDFFPDDEEECRRVWRAFLDNGHLHIEIEECRFDGSLVWIEGDYLWLRNAQGEITGHFGIQRDVTDATCTAWRTPNC